ncbi:Putative pectinesterase 11 [Linum grandiflorum]
MIHILPTTIILTLLLLSQTLASSTTTPRNWSVAKLIRVDNSAPGRGDFETIQEAIDSVPSNNSELVFIWVKPGVNEKGGIFESATFSVLAPYFVARYLTIQGGKAVALRVSGDKAAFYDCRILSYQDTLLDDNGSHYYRNCYIEGATDFICGDASSLFEVIIDHVADCSILQKCHIHSLSKHNGSITAHDRDSESDQTGYVFLGCKGTLYRTVFYGEYKNYGPGADRSKRVAWSKKLAIDEVSGFLSKNMIGGRSWIRPKPKFFRIGSKVFKAGTHGTPSMT